MRNTPHLWAVEIVIYHSSPTSITGNALFLVGYQLTLDTQEEWNCGQMRAFPFDTWCSLYESRTGFSSLTGVSSERFWVLSQQGHPRGTDVQAHVCCVARTCKTRAPDRITLIHCRLHWEVWCIATGFGVGWILKAGFSIKVEFGSIFKRADYSGCFTLIEVWCLKGAFIWCARVRYRTK